MARRLFVIVTVLLFLGAPATVFAGICKSISQKPFNPLPIIRLDPGLPSLTVELALEDGTCQGPAPDDVTQTALIAAVLVPQAWSGITIDWDGVATVTQNGSVLATLDSTDIAHCQSVMDQFGISYDTPVVKPAMLESSPSAALAQAAEPAPTGYKWVGFSTRVFYKSSVPQTLWTSLVRANATVRIHVANAPISGPTQIVLRGGDTSEGIGTIRTPVFVQRPTSSAAPGYSDPRRVVYASSSLALLALLGAFLFRPKARKQ